MPQLDLYVRDNGTRAGNQDGSSHHRAIPRTGRTVTSGEFANYLWGKRLHRYILAWRIYLLRGLKMIQYFYWRTKLSGLHSARCHRLPALMAKL